MRWKAAARKEINPYNRLTYTLYFFLNYQYLKQAKKKKKTENTGNRTRQLQTDEQRARTNYINYMCLKRYFQMLHNINHIKIITHMN